MNGRGPSRGVNSAGLVYGVAANMIWGLLPLFFLALSPAGPVEIVANRVLWASVFCAVIITALGAWRRVTEAVRAPRTLLTLTASAVLIAVNWLVYTYGVVSGQVMEASLGYFINPIVSALLGVVFLREKLRPLQWAAIGLGVAAVFVLAVGHAAVPWIALTLAFSFGFYGFLKKLVGSKVDTLTSLSVETVLLLPIALGVIVWLESTGSSTLFTAGFGHFGAMAASGAVTAVPLFFFGAAASRLPLATVGLLQYLTPALQFVLAVLVFGEAMEVEQWVGYSLVWLGLAMLTLDAFRAVRRTARDAGTGARRTSQARSPGTGPADRAPKGAAPQESCKAAQSTAEIRGGPTLERCASRR